MFLCLSKYVFLTNSHLIFRNEAAIFGGGLENKIVFHHNSHSFAICCMKKYKYVLKIIILFCYLTLFVHPKHLPLRAIIGLICGGGTSPNRMQYVNIIFCDRNFGECRYELLVRDSMD